MRDRVCASSAVDCCKKLCCFLPSRISSLTVSDCVHVCAVDGRLRADLARFCPMWTPTRVELPTGRTEEIESETDQAGPGHRRLAYLQYAAGERAFAHIGAQ
eukprot:6196523-Pleurochrysis_carterae.AAC.1